MVIHFQPQVAPHPPRAYLKLDFKMYSTPKSILLILKLVLRYKISSPNASKLPKV